MKQPKVPYRQLLRILGVTVDKMTELRKAAREAGVSMRVAKVILITSCSRRHRF